MATVIGSRPLKDQGLYRWFPMEDNDTGQVVTVDTSLSISAVWACVDLLATTVAGLPLDLYRRVNEDREKDYNNPLYPILHDAPNDYQTAFDFKDLQMRHLLLQGNCYAKIVSTTGNPVRSLLPLDPTRVEPFWYQEGVRAYRYTPEGGTTTVLFQSEVFHVMAYPTVDGLMGQSVIGYHSRTLGSAIGASKFGAKFYKDGARPDGVLEFPGALSDTAYQNLKESWDRRHRGVNNAHRTAILENGITFRPITMAPEDAQYIETMKFGVDDIARIFGVPPHLVGSMERATFNNIEQQDLNYVKHSVRRWTTRWEQAVKRDLIVRPANFAEFNFNDLLKGDLPTRYEAYSTAIMNGIMSVNEVRRKENMNPVEGGDQHFRPLNLAPLDAPPAPPQDAPRNADDIVEFAKLIASNGNGVSHD